MNIPAQKSGPWYREPWPWLLMAGPAIVVVAGFVMLWLALKYEDGLVADDYYKRGLEINREIRRDAAASSLKLDARLMFVADRVRIFLSGPPAPPREVTLQLVHPTRTGLDRAVMLAFTADGWYEGALPAVPEGRWHLILEDGAGGWRLTGDWLAGAQESVRLRGGKR